MKDTFTSWLLKISAVILSICEFIALFIWGISFVESYDMFGAFIGLILMIVALLSAVLTFCLLYGFAEHIRRITYISDKIEKFDNYLDAYIDRLIEANKKADEEKVELNDYGDLNNMSL